MKKISLLMLFAVSAVSVFAQTSVGLPTCSGYDASLIYMVAGNQIYNYDPAQPLSSTNPWLNAISGAGGGDGITLGDNVYASSPAITFYVCGTPGNNYYWYNGTTWVNSGFSVGNAAAVNPVISGGNFYNLVGSTGEIYKNTPTTNGTLLTTITGFGGGGPYDLAGDVNGNFFLFDAVDSNVNEYDSTGAFVTSWTTSNTSTLGFAGGSLAFMGYTMYSTCNTTPNFWMGILSGTNYSFTPIGNLPIGPEDFASCETSNALKPGAHGPLLGVGSVAESQLKLFPNPASKELSLLTPKGSYTTYTICNVNGDVVMQGVINSTEMRIDIGRLAPASYFMRLSSEDESKTLHFVKN